jgi:hypothetical protein
MIDMRPCQPLPAIVSAFALSIAAIAFAAPLKPPAIPLGPPWGIQFPGIAEIGVYSKDGSALDALCKGTKVRVPIKSLAFERVASSDKSIYKLVQEQAVKLNPMLVKVHLKPAATCTLELKNTTFSHYAVEMDPNAKLAKERFTLAFSQATPVK